jgi:hypothetical protein
MSTGFDPEALLYSRHNNLHFHYFKGKQNEKHRNRSYRIFRLRYCIRR